VGAPTKKLQLRVYSQFSAQDNFRTATETLRGSNVAEISVGTKGSTEVRSKRIKVSAATNLRRELSSEHVHEKTVVADNKTEPHEDFQLTTGALCE
jgi:hypothetical protein